MGQEAQIVYKTHLTTVLKIGILKLQVKTRGMKYAEAKAIPYTIPKLLISRESKSELNFNVQWEETHPLHIIDAYLSENINKLRNQRQHHKQFIILDNEKGSIVDIVEKTLRIWPIDNQNFTIVHLEYQQPGRTPVFSTLDWIKNKVKKGEKESFERLIENLQSYLKIAKVATNKGEIFDLRAAYPNRNRAGRSITILFTDEVIDTLMEVHMGTYQVQAVLSKGNKSLILPPKYAFILKIGAQCKRNGRKYRVKRRRIIRKLLERAFNPDREKMTRLERK